MHSGRKKPRNNEEDSEEEEDEEEDACQERVPYVPFVRPESIDVIYHYATYPRTKRKDRDQRIAYVASVVPSPFMCAYNLPRLKLTNQNNVEKGQLTQPNYNPSHPVPPYIPAPSALITVPQQSSSSQSMNTNSNGGSSSSSSQLQVCLVCLENSVGEDMLTCSKKHNHDVCKNCLCTWLKLQMPHAEVSLCKKIAGNKCEGEFDIVGLESHLPSMWFAKQQFQKAAQNIGVPFVCPGCSYDCLMEFKELSEQKEAQCPICNTVICTLCFARGHANITCTQAKTLQQHVEVVEGTLRCGHCHIPGVLEKNTCLKSTCSGCFGITCACCGKALSKSKTCSNEEELYNQHYCRALPTDAVPTNGTCKHKYGENHCWLWNSSNEANHVDHDFAMRHPHLVPGAVKANMPMKSVKTETKIPQRLPKNLISIVVWVLTKNCGSQTKRLREECPVDGSGCSFVKLFLDLDDPPSIYGLSNRIARACGMNTWGKHYNLYLRGPHRGAPVAEPLVAAYLTRLKDTWGSDEFYFTEDVPPTCQVILHFVRHPFIDWVFNVDPNWSLDQFRSIAILRTGYERTAKNHGMEFHSGGGTKLTHQDEDLEVNLVHVGVSLLSPRVVPIRLFIMDK